MHGRNEMLSILTLANRTHVFLQLTLDPAQWFEADRRHFLHVTAVDKPCQNLETRETFGLNGYSPRLLMIVHR